MTENTSKPLFQSAEETRERLNQRRRSSVRPIKREITVSFEFFPPATDEMAGTLWKSIQRLGPLAPNFVSVTYGAGGSTRERTHATVKRIIEETSLTPAAHLTCVDASKVEIGDVVDRYWDAGVRHIVALRGDTQDGSKAFTPHPYGYGNAAELVRGLKQWHDFDISVGAYPEVHPDAVSAKADLDNLKRKIDAGANRAITQFFFEADVFLRFRDRAVAAGIDAPIIPGILPVTNFSKLKSFATRCAASVPDWMGVLFEGLDDAPDIRQLVSATVTAELCTRLRDHGVNDFHFYTLNRSDLTTAICRILGVFPVSTMEKPESNKTIKNVTAG